MKRLRKRAGHKIRYFQCGEYGEDFSRPHYHACLFNYDFPDRKYFKTKNGHKYYTSEILSELWSDPETKETYGHCIIGDVTFESAAYVARYIMKKINGEPADKHYRVIDPGTGEIIAQRTPEYTTMSRRPGIGSDWLKKYRTDVYPADHVIIRGRPMKPPKYYDKEHEIKYPSDYAKMRGKRVRSAEKQAHNNTPRRLKDRETCQKAKAKLLTRGLENDH